MRITRTLANIVVSYLEKVSLSLDVMSTYPSIQITVLTGGDTTYLSLLFLQSVSTVSMKFFSPIYTVAHLKYKVCTCSNEIPSSCWDQIGGY